MSRVRQRGTKPELAVRAVARSVGLYYRTRNGDLTGSPDLANRRRKWAIFVNGCFWHRHDGCSKATTPKANRDFWLAKFARNVQRDRNARLELRRRGYRVLVIWECQVPNSRALYSRLRRLKASVEGG